MRRALLATGACLLLALGAYALRAVRAGAADGPPLERIRAKSLASHLAFLASDRLEGRAPGSTGGRLAAEYLAARLAALGLSPAGDGGTYLQHVPLVERVLEPSFGVSTSTGLELRHPDDVVMASGTSAAALQWRGELVFAGYGIVAPEFGWDDYAGLDMHGKVALVMPGEPEALPEAPGAFGGGALTRYGRWPYKLEQAARLGAAGVLLIHTGEAATYPWSVVQHSWGGPQYTPAAGGTPAPVFHGWVRESAAARLLLRAGHDLDGLRRRARVRGMRALPLGVDLAARAGQRVRGLSAPNVVAVLRGNDPVEAVVFTAHYDHLGTRPVGPGTPEEEDRIFNGALDNASGVAGLLEIAAALSGAPIRPRRSIYFVFTTAEEWGLLGARYFVAHPPAPASVLAAGINLDTLNLAGPSRDLVLLGSELSTLGPVARRIAARFGRVVRPDPDPSGGAFLRGDHLALAEAGIPAVGVGSPAWFLSADQEASRRAHEEWTGVRYHQPNDEVSAAFDYAGAVPDLRVLASLGWALASAPERPTYRRGLPLSPFVAQAPSLP